MSARSDQRQRDAYRAREIYTRKTDAYVSFVSRFRHQAGIAALLDRSGRLRDRMSILDAGCGTGFATFAILDVLNQHGWSARQIDAFDLTPSMLTRFRQTLALYPRQKVEVREADVRQLEQLPGTWTHYDLIISVSMLEYVSKRELPEVLRELRSRLAPEGTLIVVITRKNPVTWWLIEKVWQAQRYSRHELLDCFAAAGFKRIAFSHYPWPYVWLTLSNHVVVASE